MVYKEKWLAALEKGKTKIKYAPKSKAATKNVKALKKKDATKRKSKRAAAKKASKRGGKKSTKRKAQQTKSKKKGVVAKVVNVPKVSADAKGEKVKASKKEKQIKIVAQHGMGTRRRSRDADLQITEKPEAASGVHSKAKSAKQKKPIKKQVDDQDDMLNLETPSK